MAEENTEKDAGALDLSALGSFDFTPAWAKGKPDDKAKFARFEEREERRDRGERPRFGQGGPRRDDRGPRRGDRGPRRDDRGPRRDDRGPRPSFGKPSMGGRRDDRGPREFIKPLDVDVRILPGQKQLGEFIRRIQGAPYMAYPLKQLAYFFLEHLEACVLRVSPKKDAAEPIVFHQCKACGFVAFSEEELMSHILSAHLGDYYVSEEVECEAPKGAFTCVAKCGLSGVLLGPPNIHEFNAVVKEMIRTKYPDMSEVQYRAHIEMVRDADTIEEWRKSATKKTMFFAKGTADQEGALALTREQAEGEFKRNVLPSMLDTPKNLMITAEVAMKSPVKPLQWAANDALQAERRAPYNMCFALRGAFHHRKLKFFRANDARGQEFVTNVEYKEFDAEHAIPELAQAAKFVAEHPCCDKSEFPQDVPDFEKHIEWLVTTGHVVAFTNGVFSAVEKFPKYGPQWKKRGGKAAEAKAEGVGVGEEKAKAEEVRPVEPVEKVEEVKDETAPVVAE